MVRLASLLTGDRAVGEEIAQEAFVRVHDRIEAPDRPGAYLRTTVVNLCRGHGRRRAVADRTPMPVGGVAGGPDLPRELSEVWIALDKLPDRQREALVLRFYLDLPDDRIAEHLGARPGTVRSLIARGLAALEKDLSK